MTGILKAMPLALAAVLGAAAPAAGQTVCGTREAIIAELSAKYGETRRAIGLQEGRGIVEVWASEATGSWTILVTNTAGRTCLVAAGEAFEAETAVMSGTPA